MCFCIQQGGQLLSTAGGNVYNVVQPMQTVTVDGQEALFIPASQQQQLQLGGQTLITPSGQVIRSPNIIPASLLQGQTLQFPGGKFMYHYILISNILEDLQSFLTKVNTFSVIYFTTPRLPKIQL